MSFLVSILFQFLFFRCVYVVDRGKKEKHVNVCACAYCRCQKKVANKFFPLFFLFCSFFSAVSRYLFLYKKKSECYFCVLVGNHAVQQTNQVRRPTQKKKNQKKREIETQKFTKKTKKTKRRSDTQKNNVPSASTRTSDYRTILTGW